MRLSRLAVTAITLCSSAIAQAPLKPRPIESPAPAASELPITRVALYKNGVGFFEHAGRVTGDQTVTIAFTTAQLNDVLQSLTAIDLNGGRISGAGYNSTTPLDEQLKTLSLSLNATPTEEEIRTHMQPGLCRCGTHVRILRAVRRAAGSFQAAKKA